MGVPADTDEITQEWLTAALHQAGALDQAQVTSIQSAPVGQLGFTGQIRQLQISYDKPEPGAPRSLVAKFSATDPDVRAAVHSMGFYEREIGFYRELGADSRRISVSRAVIPSLARCGGTADVEPFGTLAPTEASVRRTRRCRARSPAALQNASASRSQPSATDSMPAWWTTGAMVVRSMWRWTGVCRTR